MDTCAPDFTKYREIEWQDWVYAACLGLQRTRQRRRARSYSSPHATKTNDISAEKNEKPKGGGKTHLRRTPLVATAISKWTAPSFAFDAPLRIPLRITLRIIYTQALLNPRTHNLRRLALAPAPQQTAVGCRRPRGGTLLRLLLQPLPVLGRERLRWMNSRGSPSDWSIRIVGNGW